MGCHPYDLGMMLDANGIAVRTGHFIALNPDEKD